MVATEDRGSHTAHKLLLNISEFSRVPGYLLVPRGEGPFPGIVALHDHGAHFSIGKEKVIEPFDVPEAVHADALDWITKYYGGRWIGDELASRGYVVFSIDALFWGDRGRKDNLEPDLVNRHYRRDPNTGWLAEYPYQQAVASNILQLDMNWVGIVTWDDVRSAEFLASRPEVDPSRIGTLGLSMGSHRTWMLAAATDHIRAGAAICWMCTTDALMVPGNNQTVGYSSYSMLVPGLRHWLDYPDVASIACPKPMMFQAGLQDPLFPVPGVEDAYATMRKVWESQGVGDRLVTEFYDVPHLFNQTMQESAFGFLDRHLKR